MTGGEIWRTIPDWPQYEASSLGRIRRDGYVLKPWRTKAGRWQVRLCAGPITKAYNTYTLIALTFLGPKPFPKAVVAHYDDDLDNNTLPNLRWCTMKENGQDKIRNGRCATGLRNGAHTRPDRRPCGERIGNAKLTWEAVRAIRASSERSGILAERYGVGRQTISKARRGDTWTTTDHAQAIAA